MKKITLITILTVFMLILTGCHKSDSPTVVLEEMADAFDDLIADMEKSDDVDSAIVSIEKFSVVMKKLKPRMDKVKEKYPDIDKTFKGKREFPEEFKDLKKRFEEIGPKLSALMGKMIKYMGDPKFQEAQRKFQESIK